MTLQKLVSVEIEAGLAHLRLTNPAHGNAAHSASLGMPSAATSALPSPVKISGMRYILWRS